MMFQRISRHRVSRMLRATAAAWMEDHALRLSAALAYYSVFSIAPLLVIAVSVAGLVLGEDAVRGQLGHQLQGFLGAQVAQGVEAMVKGASKPSEGWLGAVVGFGMLLLGASGVFGQLKDALNTIWEVKVKRADGILAFLRERLLNFGMVLAIGFLLLTSLILTATLAAFSGWVEHLFGLPVAVGGVLAFVVSFGMVTLLFAFIFKVLPDAKIEWRNVWIGASVTALLFEVGKLGLGVYLARESTASSFGAAGSLVIVLLWVYYASCILLFGAEFTKVYALESGKKIPPADNALAVTTDERAQQGLVDPAQPPRALPSLPPLIVRLPPPRTLGNPAGVMLGVVAAGFVTGLLVRRYGAK